MRVLSFSFALGKMKNAIGEKTIKHKAYVAAICIALFQRLVYEISYIFLSTCHLLPNTGKYAAKFCGQTATFFVDVCFV